MLCSLLYSADSALGKVTRDSLPHHTLLELLSEGFINGTDGFIRDKVAVVEIEQWKKLTIDKNGNVTSITWMHFLSPNNIEGTIDLNFIPPTVEVFNISFNKISGSISLIALPTALRGLKLNSNMFSGSVDLTLLPEHLQTLWLDSNKLSGTVDLTSLPKEIKWITLFQNALVGEPDFTQLPESLQILDISETNIEGTPDFSKIPDSLELFDVANTRLSGSIVVQGNLLFKAAGSNVQVTRGQALADMNSQIAERIALLDS
uniref:Leucine-rich repeat protein n=1 Tax=Paramoeba aestuarina TaxID=180227 RepID=A0A7S4PA33_9EUKA|mmetsp:Transcript_38792/g.61445  ORF Transcript_38792/g.61445 Transcript_38792/m.61445 type:complete len:261 (+) Transcript_38792:39-821(+)